MFEKSIRAQERAQERPHCETKQLKHCWICVKMNHRLERKIVVTSNYYDTQSGTSLHKYELSPQVNIDNWFTQIHTCSRAGAKFLTHRGSRTYSQLLSEFCDESAVIALAYPIHIHRDLYPNLILLTVRYFCVIQDQPHYQMFPTGYQFWCIPPKRS